MNRLLRCTSVWLMVACGVVVAQTRRINAPQTDNVPLALTHVAVIDATGSPAQLEMTVIISGGRITGLGARCEGQGSGGRAGNRRFQEIPDPRPLGHAHSRGRWRALPDTSLTRR